MVDLVVIVEGETEQTFVRDQLAAHLAIHATNVWAVLPGRRRNHGGVKKWEVARQDIIHTLRERRDCSTMFDYYGMPLDWPGRREANAKERHERAKYVQDMVHAEITQAMGDRFDPKYFIPYVQLHEFEVLAFADVDVLVSVLAPIAALPAETLIERLKAVLDEARSPEAINDGYETCPSRRISGIVPVYQKRALGPIITGRIGIETLRTRCPHFGDWVARLEHLDARGA